MDASLHAPFTELFGHGIAIVVREPHHKEVIDVTAAPRRLVGQHDTRQIAEPLSVALRQVIARGIPLLETL